MKHAKLQARVFESLDNAVENGYEHDVMGDPEIVAIDTATYDAGLEKVEIEDLVPHVKAWQERRRAGATS